MCEATRKHGSERVPAQQCARLPDRGLRPTKTQQKIAGRLTSEDITQDRLDIRSYIDTMRKHRVDVLTGIRSAITGNPWRPPIPTPPQPDRRAQPTHPADLPSTAASQYVRGQDLNLLERPSRTQACSGRALVAKLAGQRTESAIESLS